MYFTASVVYCKGNKGDAYRRCIVGVLMEN